MPTHLIDPRSFRASSLVSVARRGAGVAHVASPNPTLSAHFSAGARMWLAARLVRQLVFYLGNDNFPHDKFLLVRKAEALRKQSESKAKQRTKQSTTQSTTQSDAKHAVLIIHLARYPP